MKKISGKPKDLKIVNQALVMESIRLRENATRAEIVADTGISHTTVRNILTELIAADDIVTIGLDDSSGGRRAERYALNTSKNYILSVFLEEKKLIYNIVNRVGEIIEENSLSLQVPLDESVVDGILNELLDKYKSIKIIGITVPGIVSEEGYLSGGGMDNLTLIKINKHIEKKYNIPVVLENDLNSILLGFSIDYINANTSKDLNIAYINFTTLGAGAGIMVNGNLVRGKDNFAGEVGFLPIGDSYVNELLFKNLNDESYCSLVVTILKIIDCIINPKVIVLGGNDFRYNLTSKIKEAYEESNKITSELLTIEDSCKLGLKGITKLSLDLINDNIKLIDKRGALND